MRQIPEHTFFTVQEVSSFLKLSVLTIYKYIKEEKLEAIELGGHYRIPQTALEMFINKHKVDKNGIKRRNDGK